jgi:uncharacterized membrane protein YkvA (DUF1232 family)
MDMSDLLTVVIVLLGVLALLGVTVIGFAMWRYRIPPRGLIAMIGALVYLASPVDVLPEVMLGPFGLLDDAGAVTAAAVFVYKLVTVKRRLEDAGVKGRRRPDLLELPRCSGFRSAHFGTADNPGRRPAPLGRHRLTAMHQPTTERRAGAATDARIPGRPPP